MNAKRIESLEAVLNQPDRARRRGVYFYGYEDIATVGVPDLDVDSYEREEEEGREDKRSVSSVYSDEDGEMDGQVGSDGASSLVGRGSEIAACYPITGSFYDEDDGADVDGTFKGSDARGTLSSMDYWM